MPDLIFDLGQAGMIAVSRTRRGVNKSLHTGVASSDEHVDETQIVRRMGAQRVFDGPRNGTESRFMQDNVDSIAGLATRFEIDDIGLIKRVPLPRLLADIVD